MIVFTIFSLMVHVYITWVKVNLNLSDVCFLDLYFSFY